MNMGLNFFLGGEMYSNQTCKLAEGLQFNWLRMLIKPVHFILPKSDLRIY